ncbi:pentatricopeptide repeat-containing protein At1g63400-like isoform X1 [Mercurialis annua]|uniref:pentatricopeptide repeat-containing protein At1g63400-like isoform X1 n=1 Tax=Mercurialis annua TaxID=3986 RepID=UPI00215E46B1|nr:pentatricopeptide repeat-containing protein At1g63400-like isoform X1 [Mercurialis annua]XP_050237075.1 pentatricopeptide repeat-containing protein At1g63400-like isoform X1 [Mercurialis annua]
MSAKVRRLGNSLKVQSSLPFFRHSHICYSKTLNPYFLLQHHSHSSNSHTTFDYFYQFSPFYPSTPNPNHHLSSLNSNERRLLVVGLGTLIKLGQTYLLKGFSHNFCPSFLVNIMRLLDNRQTAFAFFKFVFHIHSDASVHSYCSAAHLLAAEDLQLLAQDVISWVIQRLGASWSTQLVEIMWANHHRYESDFSVLNTLMRGFMNAGMPQEALEIVVRMRDVGVRPSSSAISILFRLLLRVGDYGSVWKLLRGMIREGPLPCNHNFNIMILCFCQKGYLQVGESLLFVMQKFRCQPDVYAYNILINAYRTRGRTSDALGLLHLMIKNGCKPSSITFSTIITAFCNEGNVMEARKLFDGIQEVGLSPNVSMYNTLMNGYFKARNACQANMLYEEMRNKGISPDGATFNILVAGNQKYGREEDSKRLFRHLSGLNPDCSLYDISVAGLCWAGKLDEAMECLEDLLEKGIPLSVIAFNSVISAYSMAGFEENAHKAYKVMAMFDVLPSSSTCSSLLLGLSKKGRLQEARNLLYKMLEKDFPINKVAYTVLLDGYFKVGDTAGAHSLWHEMEARGMYPDAVAFSAFIDGLSKAGLVEEGYEVFLEMLRKGFVPNNFIYNSLIQGFCNCGKLDEALKLENKMRQNGLLPDTFTMNIIINGFCKEGRMRSAHDTFVDMRRIGLTPDVITYNTLIGGYCKVSDMVSADDFVNRMCATGWDPDITTYNIRIHGSCISRKMSQAVMMLDELMAVGIVPDTVTYNILMNAVCTDILDRAMILTAKLLKMAFVPNVVTTNVLLSHFCKQGMPEKTLIWSQKLSDISFNFDEISNKIMDKAYLKIHNNAKQLSAASEKCLFMDFLMYNIYDYFRRTLDNKRKDPVEQTEKWL